MQQIMMVGAGSVGGFFGAHLAKRNPNVSFLLRPRTLQAVSERGLTIRSAAGTLTVRPPAASDPRELPRPDLIILSVKAYDLDEVMDQIEPVMTDRTVLLTLQNGVDTEDRLVARFHFGARFHRTGPPGGRCRTLSGPSLPINGIMPCQGGRPIHTTIAIDVQYYEK